jgi:hypothetical protein
MYGAPIPFPARGPAMTSRAELIAEWRSRLDDCERQLDEPDPAGELRWTWLRRMYAQVLRYLIARYEDEDAAGEVDVSASAGSRMSFHEAGDVGPGKPARSPETIRGVLDTIHANVPGMPAGSYCCGRDDPIVVESFYDGQGAEQARRLLKSRGLANVRLTREGRVRQLWTTRADFEVAQAILSKHGFPKRRVFQQARGSMIPAGMLLGLIAGAFLAVSLEVVGIERPALVVAAALSGMAIGVIADIIRSEF